MRQPGMVAAGSGIGRCEGRHGRRARRGLGGGCHGPWEMPFNARRARNDGAPWAQRVTIV
jgi:hypothetical protein